MGIDYRGNKKVRIGFLGVLIALFVCFGVATKVVYAQEWGGTVPVTYMKDVSDAYPLSIHVSGPGEVLLEEDVLRNKERSYLIAIDESKTIRFKADKGATVKVVTLDGKKVTHEIKDNSLTIAGKENKQSLVVEFQRITGNGNTPVTGDFVNSNFYIFLLLLSLGIFIYMYVWKREDRSSKVVREREEYKDGEK